MFLGYSTLGIFSKKAETCPAFWRARVLDLGLRSGGKISWFRGQNHHLQQVSAGKPHTCNITGTCSQFVRA